MEAMSLGKATSQFRQRGYKNLDTGDIVMIFGMDPAPVGNFRKEWDVLVTSEKVTVPFVEDIGPGEEIPPQAP